MKAIEKMMARIEELGAAPSAWYNTGEPYQWMACCDDGVYVFNSDDDYMEYKFPNVEEIKQCDEFWEWFISSYDNVSILKDMYDWRTGKSDKDVLDSTDLIDFVEDWYEYPFEVEKTGFFDDKKAYDVKVCVTVRVVCDEDADVEEIAKQKLADNPYDYRDSFWSDGYRDSDEVYEEGEECDD